MADDTNFRSNPPTDRHHTGQAPARGREAGHERNDPLAELARLIGQTDPFGDLKQNAPRAPAPPRPAPAAMPPQRGPAAPSDPYGSPLQFDSRPFPEPRGEGFQPAYDPAIYGAPQQQEPGHPSEAYYEDPSHPPQGDKAYDEGYGEERPRRGLMKVVVALVVFAIIGTGGVFGYRVLYNGVASGLPPVIKANTAPSKIAPAPTAETSNKQIYDRVGDPSSQGERVVSREEKPVEVKDNARPASRGAFPSMPGSSGSLNTGMAEASPSLGVDPGGSSAGEPKKVRTVTIRPDTSTSSTASGQRPNGAPPVQRNAGPAPITAPSTAQGGTPLSLSPQVASAEASARPAFPPPPPSRPTTATFAPGTRLAAVPPTTDVGSDSYTVQISSQRSEADAQTSFRSLQAKFPSLLGDRQPIVRKADLGEKGIYFRTMVGPFASMDEAKQFCGNLKSAGGQCVIPRN